MDENTIAKGAESILNDEINARRNEAVQNFKMEFTIDDIPDVEVHYPAQDEVRLSLDSVPAPASLTEQEYRPRKKEKKPRSKAEGCLLKVIYGLLILGISGFLASMLLVFVLDSMAINRTEKVIDIELTDGATTTDVANLLVEKGLIDNAFCFRVYSRISGADGKWQRGAFTVSPDMGYATLVETLQTMTPRETVTVTIPEGYTVEEIARLLEENGVCDPNSFYDAVVYGEFDYDFIDAIPTAQDGDEYAGRIYRLEGYLFPDTYNFYVGSSGETVVARMLENFDRKLTPEIRQQIADRGWTVDQAIIVASLVEGEAASKEDMEKVSKVLQNRMAPNSGYPKLELCSTRDYVKAILPSIDGIAVTSIAYNTYERTGLPVGAINNPGLQALTAALNPSTAEDMENCYFFATDYNTGITYFSKTFSEHERICRKYKIGMYG